VDCRSLKLAADAQTKAFCSRHQMGGSMAFDAEPDVPGREYRWQRWTMPPSAASKSEAKSVSPSDIQRRKWTGGP